MVISVVLDRFKKSLVKYIHCSNQRIRRANRITRISCIAVITNQRSVNKGRKEVVIVKEILDRIITVEIKELLRLC